MKASKSCCGASSDKNVILCNISQGKYINKTLQALEGPPPPPPLPGERSACAWAADAKAPSRVSINWSLVFKYHKITIEGLFIEKAVSRFSGRTHSELEAESTQRGRTTQKRIPTKAPKEIIIPVGSCAACAREKAQKQANTADTHRHRGAPMHPRPRVHRQLETLSPLSSSAQRGTN